MLSKSQLLRIAALAALIGLGVAASLRESYPAPVIVTASPLVTATPYVAHSDKSKRYVDSGDKPRHDPPPVAKASAVQAFPAPGQPAENPASNPTNWSLPVSCNVVRWYMKHFSKGMLEAMRKLSGYPPPTPEQEAQALACFHGQPSV